MRLYLELLHRMFHVHYARGSRGPVRINWYYWTFVAFHDQVGVSCVICQRSIRRDESAS